jgi:hypothetical protein
VLSGQSEELGHRPRGAEAEPLVQLFRSIFVVGADEEIVVVASSHDRRECKSCADSVSATLGPDIRCRDFSLVSNPLECRVPNRLALLEHREGAGLAQPRDLDCLVEVIAELVTGVLLGVPICSSRVAS